MEFEIYGNRYYISNKIIKTIRSDGSMLSRGVSDTQSRFSYNLQVNHDLSNIDMDVTSDTQGNVTYCIDFNNVPESLSAMSTVFDSKLSLTYILEDAEKLPHDLVCYMLTNRQENEISLSRFGFPRNCSPDIFAVVNNNVVFGEIKTSRYQANLNRSADSALAQYPDIDNLYYLACSPSNVVTNLILTPDDISLLCAAYKIGSSAVLLATSKGIKTSRQIEMQLNNKKVKNSIMMMKGENYNDPLCIDSSELEDLPTVNMRDVMSRRDEIFQLSTNELSEKMEITEESETKKGNKWLQDRVLFQKNNPTLFKTGQPSVVKFGFFWQKEQTWGIMDPIRVVESENVMTSLWLSILNAAGGFSNYESESFLDDDKVIDMEKEEAIKKQFLRGEKYKIDSFMVEKDKEKLAVQGISGKKYSMLEEKKLADQNSKKFIDITTDTSVVDKFLLNSEHFVLEDVAKCELSSNFIDLHSAARLLSQDSVDDLALDAIKTISNTRMGSFLWLMSQVFSEINLSITSNVKSDQFILKKLHNLPILLLIKPTKSTTNIFCSILIDNRSDCFEMENIEGIFKPFIPMCENVFATEFFSLNRSKLSNLLPCYEMYVMIATAWLDIYRVPVPDMHKTILLNTLIYLEDKNGTSKALQQCRYAYMELLSSKSCAFGPLKVLSKVPDKQRSVLELFVVKKYISGFPKMVNKLQTSLEDVITEEKGDLQNAQENFPNLINVFTNELIGNFSIALNLSYLCQFKDKNGMSEIHSNRKILVKIIKEEIKLRKLDTKRIGKPKSVKDCVNHQYDSNLVRYSASCMKKFICKSQGVKENLYDLFIEDRYLSALSKHSVESIATFKSSAKIRPFNNISDLKDKEVIDPHRRRVLEGIVEILSELDDNSSIFTSIDKIFKQFNSSELGFIIASLFRKAQIGSDREIFILSICSRLLILMLETFSRSYCDLIPWELLTKGKEKLSRVSSHKLKEMREWYIRKDKDCTLIRSYDSNDASSWAQSFIMRMFGDMLFVLSPKQFHEGFRIVLNAITRKQLEIPGNLLLEFKRTGHLYMDDGLNELQAQFKGLSTHNDLCEPSGSRLKNRSNMMQGIPHYTSTLYNSCKMYFDMLCFDSFIKRMNNIIYSTVSDEIIPKLVLTTCVTSDDTSLSKSIICPNDSNKKRYMNALSIMSMFVKYSNQCFGITLSVEKSTLDVRSGILEFNSMWTVRNTIMSPRVKYVYPALMPATTRGVEDKMHQMSNLRSQMLENGFTLSSLDICQVLQAHQFYSTMGMYLNPAFHRFVKTIIRTPLSGLGLFLYEPSLLCGVLGLDFAQWVACYRDRSYLKTEMTVSKMTTDVSLVGKPTIKWSIIIGSDKKFHEFLKRLPIKLSDQKEKISDKSVYLRPSINLDESLLKIMLKATKPSSAESFSFQNVSKVYTLAAYAITHRSVITIDSSVADSVKKEKTSLLSASKSLNDKVDSSVISDEDMENYINTAYPASSIYKTLYLSTQEKQLSKRIITAKTTKSLAYRMVKAKISKSEFQNLGSLKDCLLKMWFGISTMTISKSNSIFRSYKSMIPWLSPDIQESLADSPFEDLDSMLSHLSQISPRSRTVSIMMPSGKQNSLFKLIDSLQKLSFLPGSMVSYATPSNDDRYTHVSINKSIKDNTLKINDHLIRLCTSPDYQHSKIASITEFIRHNDNLESDYNLSGLLGMRTLLRSGNSDDIFDIMSTLKHNSFCLYLKSQRYDSESRKWVGEAELAVIIEGFRMLISIVGDRITKIVVNDGSKLLSLSSILCKVLSNHLKDLKPGFNSYSDFYFNIASRTFSRYRNDQTQSVSVNEELTFRPVLMKNVDLNITFSRHRVDLNMTSGELGKQTLISHKLRYQGTMIDDSFDLPTNFVVPRPVLSCWLENKSINLGTMLGYIISRGLVPDDRLNNDYNEYGRASLGTDNHKEAVDWISRTLDKRLFERGYLLKTKFTTAVEETVEMEDNIDQAEMNDFFDLEGFGDEIDELEFESEDDDDKSEAPDVKPLDDSIEEMFNFDNGDDVDFNTFDLFAEVSSQVSITTYSSSADIFERHNSFWDKFIDYMESDDLMHRCMILSKAYYGEDETLKIIDFFRSSLVKSRGRDRINVDFSEVL